MLEEHANFLYRELGIERLIRQLTLDGHSWGDTLEQDIRQQLRMLNHGDISRWISLLNSLPDAGEVTLETDRPAVRFGADSELSRAALQQLLSALCGLRPQRSFCLYCGVCQWNGFRSIECRRSLRASWPGAGENQKNVSLSGSAMPCRRGRTARPDLGGSFLHGRYRHPMSASGPTK